MSTRIDAHAIVSPKARLGEGVAVGPYAVIEDDVEIGDRTRIGPHCTVFSGTQIGRECVATASASIGAPPQDLKYKGEPTRLIIGDRCTIREFVTLNRATTDTGTTVIGNDCLFMTCSHVAHDCRVGDNVILANCVPLGGHVEIDDWSIVGGLTPVHQFVRIGQHTMIGGGFRVVKDVPPFIMAGQYPLVFEGLNSVGLRRRGFSPRTLELLEKSYTLLYRSNLNVSQAAARIRQEVELVPEVECVLKFIADSKRGILPGKSRH